MNDGSLFYASNLCSFYVCDLRDTTSIQCFSVSVCFNRYSTPKYFHANV